MDPILTGIGIVGGVLLFMAIITRNYLDLRHDREEMFIAQEVSERLSDMKEYYLCECVTRTRQEECLDAIQ